MTDIISEVTTVHTAAAESNEPISDTGQTSDTHLLKKLEEQNRLLESDSRYRQRINSSITTRNSVRDNKQAKELLTETKGRSRSLTLDSSQAMSSIPEDGTTPTTMETPTEATPMTTQRLDSNTSIVEMNTELSNEDKADKLLKNWGNIIKNWDEIYKKNYKMIQTYVRQGIPGPLRGVVWQLLAGPLKSDLKDSYPTLITKNSPFEKSIQRDLARTFPDHALFKDKDGVGQESLMNMMKAYSIYDSEVGYCQGSLFIAGVLLMHMPEEEAFCIFVHLMEQYKLREIYKPSMADLSVRFYQLQNLVEEFFPRLDIHFRALGFHTSMYSSSWFLTMFASSLPLSVVFRVMDIFLMDGMEVIFRVGLALLERSHDQLLRLDLEDMTKHFQKEIKCISDADCDVLLERAFKIKLSSKKLKKLGKEFVQRKEKQLTENTELMRLQDDNCELEKRVIALEKECASLADRLIQGQVTRAQENEEMHALRKELSILKRKVASYEKLEKKQNSRSTTPEMHPNKYFASSISGEDMREKSISAPSLREEVTTLVISNSLVTDDIKSEHATSEGNSPDSNPPYSPTANVEEILKELARTKIEKADYMDALERKWLEIRQLTQKCSQLEQELHQAKVDLQDKQIATSNSNSTQLCHHCGIDLNRDISIPTSTSTCNDNTALNDSTESQFTEILTSLKTMLQSSAIPSSIPSQTDSEL